MAESSQKLDSVNEEAAAYVDSIMSTQQAVRVGTPVTGRKRNRSAPSPTLSTKKKARNSDSVPSSPTSDDSIASRQSTHTRRALYNEAPTPAPRRKVYSKRHESGTDQAMEKLIDRLSIDISNRFSELNDRIDRLEQGLEQRISNKVAQLLDKRINTEIKRLRKDVDTHIETITDSMKAEVAADIADINKRIDTVNTSSAPDISCNIVVRNLPESQNENVKDKLKAMLNEGCGIRDMPIVTAERKKGPNGKPGTIIAKLQSVADKKCVMEKKNKLKTSRRYQQVYIHSDQTRSDRLIADNFRTILSAMKRGDSNITVRGARVVRSDSRPDTSTHSTRQDTRDFDSYRHSNRGRQTRDSRDNGNRNQRRF